jgi:radical SAM protein with 4Fe4S-binding SPASM domain
MPDQASELYAALPRLLARRGLHPVLTDSLGYFSQDDVLLRSLQGGQARPWLGCFAGLRHVGIASDGGVKGCLALSDDFLEGNVETEALAAIWADPARFPYTRSFDKAKLSGPCAECTQGELCRGGCTAVATAYEGRPGVFRHCFRLVASGPAKRTQLG